MFVDDTYSFKTKWRKRFLGVTFEKLELTREGNSFVDYTFAVFGWDCHFSKQIKK